MKRLKFKKPFNGMDNAKKLIPESYKVDGNEFEITDGNETYRVKWSSSINEGIVLTSSNKARINEDMSKIKHLMGFKSQETLGTVKGAARLDENKKFGDVLDKTKKLINESAITGEDSGLKGKISNIFNHFKSEHPDLVKYAQPAIYLLIESIEHGDNLEDCEHIFNKEVDSQLEFLRYNSPDDEKILSLFFAKINSELMNEPIAEGEHIKSGMGGSNKGKSRTDKTEVLKKDSKKQRRKADKEATKDINENDVEAFQSALGDSPKVAAAAKKVNTKEEKFEAAIAYINNMVGDNDVLKSKIGRTLLKKDDSDVVNEFDEDEYEHYRRGGRELDDYLDGAEEEARRAKEAGIFKDDLPPGPSDEEEQAAQVYEDESEEYYDFDDTTTSIEGEPGYNQSDINPIDTDLLSQIDSPDTMAGRKARKAGKSDVTKNFSQPKKGIHPLDPRKHALPYDLDSYGPDDSTIPPSEKEAQTSTASVDRYPYDNYADRFDEVFEGMYEEEDLNENVGDE